jgi:hypothetical protein
MANVKWEFEYKGKSYEFDATTDLSSGDLRRAKGWFGQPYGQWAQLASMITVGDVDALSFALWVALRKASDQCPSTPMLINFSVGEVYDSLKALDDEPEDEDANPTSSPTLDSAPTSTS